MRMAVAVLAAVFAASSAAAQTAPQPTIREGDSWVIKNGHELKGAYRQTDDETTVVRVNSSDMLISIRTVGADTAPLERLEPLDWSRVRSINGQQTTVNQPVAFPLAPGKTWSIDYTEDNPTREHKSEHFRMDYKVIGWEDVTVAAGTFKALKIEGDGHWTAVIAPAVSSVSGARVDQQGAAVVSQTQRILPQTVSGRYYLGAWYVPEVKRTVKSVQEYYSGDNVRTERYTEELESFKVKP